MASPVHDTFRDPYPIGWILTYRERIGTNGAGWHYRVGVVTGDSVRDARTGVESVPLTPPDDRADGVVWVRDDDIIGIEPRLRIRHG
ncbi:hypothetical protein [Amycolatopsis sp. CA-230715]|uniref:hypothetical protein n=1 Tax=Amycolatopsis sp. CA-230715 TaxID=2745196 RepID=UPI001C011A0B|nr:hypothetical protein [Amycolatopsis sp. CA-230715]QWF85190.1 hypothetical protein HUW46_08644 [Amycolatopsis sp. CA-230715]